MNSRPLVIALGFFDGVHLGHMAILRRASELARDYNVQSAALTFDVHPESMIYGQHVPFICTPDQRTCLMRELCGIDQVIVAHFDNKFMSQEWNDFARESLFGRFSAIHLVSGEDYRFGYRGAGSADLLAELCRGAGVGFDKITVLESGGIRVSSTYIRNLIANGDMTGASALLGHRYELSGIVTPGRRVGRTIGVPTPNFCLDAQLQPPLFGVYATYTRIGTDRYMSVTNVGVKPTLGVNIPLVETHLLDFSGDLYGREIIVEFCDLLRPERRFDDIDCLTKQIIRDIQDAKRILQYKL